MTQIVLTNPSQSVVVVIILTLGTIELDGTVWESWPSGEGKELFDNDLKYLNKLELMILNMWKKFQVQYFCDMQGTYYQNSQKYCLAKIWSHTVVTNDRPF